MNLFYRLIACLCVALIATLCVKLMPRFRRVPWATALVLAVALTCGMPLAATLLVNAGRAIITNLVSGIGGTVPKFLAIGTGAGTFSASSTTISTEVETRGTGSVSRTTTSTTNDTYTVVGTVTATAGRTVTNIGYFDVVTSSSGNLFVGVDALSIGLSSGDSLQVTLNASFA